MSSNTGWVCPICGKVNAPWVPNCSCNGNVPWTYNPGPTCSDVSQNSCDHQWIIKTVEAYGDAPPTFNATCTLCGKEISTNIGDITKWPK